MNISINAADPAGLQTPALVVFLFSDDKPGLTGRPELAGLKKVIAPRLKAGEFTADHLNVLPLFAEGKAGPRRFILVGLGAETQYGPRKLRSAAAKAAKTVREMNLDSVALLTPPPRPPLEDPAEIAETVALGASLGLYQFTEFKTENKKNLNTLKSLVIVPSDRESSPQLHAAAAAAEATAASIFLARDLINRPANLLYPEILANEARSLAKKTGLKIKVMDLEAARRKGMGAFLGVAQGSARTGRVIIMQYNGAGPRTRPLALIGKANRPRFVPGRRRAPGRLAQSPFYQPALYPAAFHYAHLRIPGNGQNGPVDPLRAKPWF